MKYANLTVIIIFLVFIGGLAIPGLFVEPVEVSISERRELAEFPEISASRVFEGTFAGDYRDFLQDQAVLREDFRAIKSYVERNVLLKYENNDVYIIDNNIYDKFYGINQRYIERAGTLINTIISSIDSDRIYISVIPSKAQMLDRNKYLLSDQYVIADYLEQYVNASYIDLMSISVEGNEDFYFKTDHHWTTEGAIKAYENLVTAMGYQPVEEFSYELATDSYVGSNYGKAAERAIEKDTIYLAYNEHIESMSICRYETLDAFKCFDSVYFRENLGSLDPYDVFIGGLGPITVIENHFIDSDDELVMFKDSYSHILAPFLAQHFKKVTLFDLRYVRKELIFENFDLTGKVILFIYSTTVLNTDTQIVN